MNHRGGAHKDFVIVDGKQRLSAVLDFLDNKIKAFGHLYSEYEDKYFLGGIDFIFKVNNLATKSDVLRWYLDINNSGTPHSTNEIQRVREMLDHEESKPQQADKPKKPKP
jgi:hypothetical protein